jgi:uncharacterized Zn-finger protein
MHLNKSQLNCSKCELTFWGKTRLLKHLRLDHNQSFNTNNKRYKCDWNECQFETRNLNNLVIHKRRHLGLKPFKCDFANCSSSFVNNSGLKLHKLNVHSNDFRYVCLWPGCGHGSKTKESYKRHECSHTGEKPFKCEWPGCEASFSLNNDLKDHKSIHDEIKKFVCDWPQCGLKFRKRRNLKSVSIL